MENSNYIKMMRRSDILWSSLFHLQNRYHSEIEIEFLQIEIK